LRFRRIFSIAWQSADERGWVKVKTANWELPTQKLDVPVRPFIVEDTQYVFG